MYAASSRLCGQIRKKKPKEEEVRNGYFKLSFKFSGIKKNPQDVVKSDADDNVKKRAKYSTSKTVKN